MTLRAKLGEGVLEWRRKWGGEEGNSKFDESCKCNNEDNIDLLFQNKEG
jgi:hypothetical protein